MSKVLYIKNTDLEQLVFDKLVTMLKVIYHPLYSMNNFVTNKSKLPQDGAQVFSLYGLIGYHVTLWVT